MTTLFYLLCMLFSFVSLINNDLMYLALGLMFAIMGILTEIKARL